MEWTGPGSHMYSITPIRTGKNMFGHSKLRRKRGESIFLIVHSNGQMSISPRFGLGDYRFVLHVRAGLFLTGHSNVDIMVTAGK